MRLVKLAHGVRDDDRALQVALLQHNLSEEADRRTGGRRREADDA